MNTPITLYHGSAVKIENFGSEKGRLYFTSDINVANNYIVDQADNATGSYGHIYMVTVDTQDIIQTEDIDQSARTSGVLHCVHNCYYRIDDLKKYPIREMTDAQIFELLK